MTTSHETTEFFEVLAKVLLRSFFLGYFLLIVWSSVIMFMPDLIYRVSKPFELTTHEINVANYCAIAFVKSCLLIFFLFPYVAIRLVLIKKPA